MYLVGERGSSFSLGRGNRDIDEHTSTKVTTTWFACNKWDSCQWYLSAGISTTWNHHDRTSTRCTNPSDECHLWAIRHQGGKEQFEGDKRVHEVRREPFAKGWCSSSVSC